MSKPAPAEAISNVNEILGSREPFFGAVSLDTHYIFCFDERGIAEASADAPGLEAITPDTYIHVAGGSLNVPYNHAVLEETARPFGVTGSFRDRVEDTVPVLIGAGIKAGVHSDVLTEKGNRIHDRSEGPVGCGYAESRGLISLRIAEQIAAIVNDAASLRPELFQGPQDYNLAHAIGAAHGRLAERQGFLGNGRLAVMAAAGKGAGIMLMRGKHTGREGIINLVPGSSLDSDQASGAGLEAYNQDSWAVQEANDRVRDAYPHDAHQQQIAELIDTIGTMRVLGVEDIVVRRPEELQAA